MDDILSKFSKEVIHLAKSGRYVLYKHKHETRIMIGFKSRLICGCCAGPVEMVYISDTNYHFSSSDNTLPDFKEWEIIDVNPNLLNDLKALYNDNTNKGE
jgi:hypothetical protein